MPFADTDFASVVWFICGNLWQTLCRDSQIIRCQRNLTADDADSADKKLFIYFFYLRHLLYLRLTAVTILRDKFAFVAPTPQRCGRIYYSRFTIYN
jgi:hypothetical protein